MKHAGVIFCLNMKKQHEFAVHLKEDGVIPDFRAPNGVRLAPVALYNSFEDVWHTVQKLKVIMDEKRYEKFENKRGVVA